MGLDKRFLLLSIILVIIIIFMSIIFFPSWDGHWWLLIIPVFVKVISFIADSRQALEKKEGSSANKTAKKKNNNSNKHDSVNIERSNVGGDILYSKKGRITQKKYQIFNIKSQSILRPGSAPPRPSLMIGRGDDINALKDRLICSNDANITLQNLTVIKGWPGVGKTTITSALAYDSDITHHYPDDVLWTSLGQKPNIISKMDLWGRQLGTDEIIKAKSLKEAQNILASLLRDKRSLLIIDDVWKAEDAIPFIVGGPGSATLVTTRLDEIANVLSPAANNIYRLKVLKDEDALQLIRTLAPSVVKQNPNECLVLVKELEGLPLALQVAGRLLNTEINYGFGVIELIDDLREGAKLLESKAPSDRTNLATETTPTIYALLQKSLDRLDDTTKECFAYFGHFAPKPAAFDIDDMKFIWQLDDPKPVIKNLVDRGLLEFIPETSHYQMHALLVMLAKSLLTDDDS